MQNTTGNATPTVDVPDLASIVAKFIEFLDAVESLVPEYQVPHGTGAKARAAGTARFAEPLMQPTITAISSSPRLRDHNTFDPVAGDAAVKYRDALRSLGQRMIAVGEALIYSGDIKLAATARSLLQTYSFAKRLVRDPEGAGLRSYVDELSRVMKKTVNHRPKVPVPAPGQTFLASAVPPDDVEDILEPDGLLPDDEE